jgi:uncharacterized protein (DUF302 family)
MTESNRGSRPWLWLVGGVLLGAALCGMLMFLVMPSMMLEVNRSRLGFDETVAQLEKAVVDEGWAHKGTSDITAELSRAGKPIDYRVKVIRLCKPEYANRVLASDPFVACLMPCAIAVWEQPDGTVKYSKMNTGLMGKMFGGTIAEVMGGAVSEDEHAMLEGIAVR